MFQFHHESAGNRICSLRPGNVRAMDHPYRAKMHRVGEKSTTADLSWFVLPCAAPFTGSCRHQVKPQFLSSTEKDPRELDLCKLPSLILCCFLLATPASLGSLPQDPWCPLSLEISSLPAFLPLLPFSDQISLPQRAQP